MRTSQMPESALLHIDPTGTELLGVWINRDSALEEFYRAGEDSAEHQYGEALVLSGSWEEQLARLPSVSPYVAWWEVVPRQPGETAERVFERLKSSFGG